MWFSPKKRIYLDYASATPVLAEARKAVEEAWDTFGNPGAIHEGGVEAQKSLNGSREKIALQLGCKSREVIFTSGGTEGNNIAILGIARKISLQQGETLLKNTHWVVSSIEHPSVLECFGEIERLGGKVSHVDPNEKGIIVPEAVIQKMKPHTILVSVGWANHEIGVVQPVRDISRAIREKDENILLHVDAGQAPLYIAPQVHTLGVDSMTLDSGKLYGPRGIGALYISNRMELAPILLGGGQERGLRAGTENVALAAGFAEAFTVIAGERDVEVRRLQKLRDDLAHGFLKDIPSVVINGDLKRALPHMFNISIPDIQSEYVTLMLDKEGISISTKSACREGENRRSHVVEALGGDEWRAQNTLRFSLGRETRTHDIMKTAEVLAEIIAKKKT